MPWAESREAHEAGFLEVASEVEWKGDPLSITVGYPSEYPELPPVVRAERILDRHQQPFTGNFCLLERPLDSWSGTRYAADLIVEELNSLLGDSAAGEEVVRANEAPIPEPASAHFFYPPGGVVLVPAGLTGPDGESGEFALQQFGKSGGQHILTEVDGKTAGEEITRALNGELGLVLKGRWRRLSAPPLVGPDGQAVLEWVRAEHPELLTPMAPPLPPKLRRRRKEKRAPELEVVGLVFPEERTAEGDVEDAWLFLLVKAGKEAHLLHAQEVSVEQRSRRVPNLVGMGEKTAVVVGLGSLGSDAAHQLARAGVGTLWLIDCDRFEANNSVRHALGIEHSGHAKALSVARVCRLANPFVDVKPLPLTLGATFHEDDKRDERGERPHVPLEALEDAVRQADIVVETTGIIQMELLVGRLAWEQGKPAVFCWLTDGSWAGELVRIIPGSTMCFTCFQTKQQANDVLSGEADSDGAMAIAQGCVHPTVTGAGFDATETAVGAVRLTVQTLLTQEDYPDAGWDHMVMNFRRDPSDEAFRRVAAEALPPNESCERCHPGAG